MASSIASASEGRCLLSFSRNLSADRRISIEQSTHPVRRRVRRTNGTRCSVPVFRAATAAAARCPCLVRYVVSPPYSTREVTGPRSARASLTMSSETITNCTSISEYSRLFPVSDTGTWLTRRHQLVVLHVEALGERAEAPGEGRPHRRVATGGVEVPAGATTRVHTVPASCLTMSALYFCCALGRTWTEASRRRSMMDSASLM